MCLAGSWVSLVGHDGSLVSSSSAPNGGGGSSSIVVVGGGVGVGGLNTDPLLAGIQNAVDKMMNSSSAGNQKRITVQFSGASNKAPVYLNYVLSVETLYAISVYWSGK